MMTTTNTKAKPGRQTKAKPKPRGWHIPVKEGEHPGGILARKLNAPYNRHGLTICQFQGPILSGLPEADRPDMLDFAVDLKARGEAIASGDLTLANHLLASQAITLDAIFTEMARRSASNMGEHLDASERYMRLALKAQANSRANLEALAKLHQPREQTVRHVHVNEGGQAVIADQFHNHTGGKEIGQLAEQPYAPLAGTGGGFIANKSHSGMALPEAKA
jgi:hypothetical protein